MNETDRPPNAPPSTPPRLSVILLTKDEAPNVEQAVESLLQQDERDLEVLVIDSASTDGTVEKARALVEKDPRVRLFTHPVNVSIGEARNQGLDEARASAVAFMSADAWAAPGWARAALAGLEDADVVYGRQAHAPDRLTVSAVVRGLRYHHFDRDTRRPPEVFASNVNAAIRRDVFHRLRYVDDGPGSALDDILFTAEAKELGHSVTYRRDMLVHHKDAVSLKQELVKNRREGYGWGLLAPRLGFHASVLVWGAGLAALVVAAAAVPSAWTIGLVGVAAFAPTLRRVATAGRRFARRAPLALAGATLIGPLFDIAFLASYLAGLRRRRDDLTGVVPESQGVSSP